MNAAIVDGMRRTGHTLPEGHFSSELMAEISRDVHDDTGFENFGIPFCMTVEAEVLGSEIDFGTLACEPKIARQVFPSTQSVVYKDIASMLDAGRIRAVAEAGERLSKANPEVPVIGSIT